LLLQVKLQVLKGGTWVDVPLATGIKAIVLMNLQSYAGGKNIWGTKTSKKDAQRGYKPPASDDGLIEVCSLGGYFM
jgi:diacylglycerol kinase (ATP)